MNKTIGYLLAMIFVFGFCVSQQVSAGFLPSGWSESIEESEINLVSEEGSATTQLKYFIIERILPIAKSIFLPVALIYLVILIFGLTVASGDEDVISSFKVKVGFLVLGLILISIAEPMGEAFDPTLGDNAKELGNVSKLEDILTNIIDYFTIISGGVAVIMMTISGVRLVASKGEDTIIEEQKRSFTYSFIGLIIILLFKRFITDILYVNYGFGGPNEKAASGMSAEIMGVIAWAMEFLAFGALGVFVLAGFYYIFSLGNDDASTKAKATMKNAMLGLLVIIISYTLVATFIPH